MSVSPHGAARAAPPHGGESRRRLRAEPDDGDVTAGAGAVSTTMDIDGPGAGASTTATESAAAASLAGATASVARGVRRDELVQHIALNPGDAHMRREAQGAVVGSARSARVTTEAWYARRSSWYSKCAGAKARARYASRSFWYSIEAETSRVKALLATFATHESPMANVEQPKS